MQPNLPTRWMDWLVPSREGDDPERRFWIDLGVVVGSLQLIAGTVFGLIELFRGTPEIGLILIAVSALLAVIIMHIRRAANPNRALMWMLCVMLAEVFIINAGTGGRAIGANIGMPMLALFAALLSHGRMTLLWLALIIVHMVAIAQLRGMNLDFPIQPNAQWVSSAIDRVPLVLSIAAVIVGWLIRNALRRFRDQLERAREAEREARRVQAAVTAQLADFAQIAADGFWETDADLKFSYASPSFFRMMGLTAQECLGYTPEEMLRKRFPTLKIDPDYMQPMRDQRAYVGQTLQSADANGQSIWLRTEGRPRQDADGAFAGYRGVIHNITDEQSAQQALRDSEQRLRLITDNLPVLISYIDSNRVFRFNNETYARWLRRPVSEITGKLVSDVFTPKTYSLIEPNLLLALTGKRLTFDLPASGSRNRYVQVTYVPDFDDEGAVRGVYGLIHDITEVRAVESELRQMSEFDQLTGLANRKRLGDKTAEAIARSERNSQLMALLFLDLDRFKAINDSLGHRGGDLVLQEFARRLQASVRQTDTVCRLAGDEFVVVLEMLHSAEEARLVAEKIIAAMTADFLILGHTQTVSASIGVAVRQPGEIEGEALLRRADAALYAAKEAGRGCVQIAA